VHEVQGISLLAEELAAFQEGLCYMELGLLLKSTGNTIIQTEHLWLRFMDKDTWKNLSYYSEKLVVIQSCHNLSA